MMRLVEQDVIASRLSCFLWGTTRDGLLFDLAADGLLQDEEVLQWKMERMLCSPKATHFHTRFVGQWLGTRELSRTKVPDPKLFPEYAHQEIQSDVRNEPIVFFQELAVKDLGGLLGMASILMFSSHPHRPSPVRRG